MTTRYLDIEKALLNSIKTIAPDLRRGLPNKNLKNKPDNQVWLQTHNLRSQSFPVTLGDQGEDHHPGIFQIDLNVLSGTGTGIVLEKADAIASFFTAGKIFVYNTQKVRVLSTSLGPGRYVGGYYRVSLDINYYSRTFRN